MHDNQIVFLINNIRGHVFLNEQMAIKFDKKWYNLVPVDESIMQDMFGNSTVCNEITIINFNNKTSDLDQFTVAYNENGLKAAKYNDKYYIAQLDDMEVTPYGF